MAKPSQIKQIIKSYFDSHKYSYDIEEKDTWALYSSFKTQSEDKKMGLSIVYHNFDINVSTVLSLPVKKEDFPVSAELMLKINRYLKRGHFFLDYKVGSINFKMWNTSKGKITVSDIDDLVLISIGSLDVFASILEQVLKQKISVNDGVKLYVKMGDAQ